MSDKEKKDVLFEKLTAILIILMCVHITVSVVFYLYQEKVEERTESIINEYSKTNEIIEQTALSLSSPDNGKQDNSEIFNNLLNQIKKISRIESAEKKYSNLTGETDYFDLEITIKKYLINNNSYEFHRSILQTIINLRIKYETTKLRIIENKNKINNQKELFYISYTFIFFIIAIITVAVCKEKYDVAISNYKEYKKRFNRFSSGIRTTPSSSIEEKLNNFELLNEERESYAFVYNLKKEIESQKEIFDVYQQLYVLIGYEIRGITNTIEGGIKILEQDADENRVILSRDISLASNALSDLAENYNHLISIGIREQEETLFLNIVSELAVHLKLKIKRNDSTAIFFINDNMPAKILANHSSLFWLLFLHLSNQLSGTKQDILIYISSKSSSDIEKVSVSIEVIFLDSLDIEIESILNRNWIKKQDNLQKETTLLRKSLTNDDFTCSKYESDELEKVVTDIAIRPINFHFSNKQLEEYTFIIHESSILESSILRADLERYGATVFVCHTVNEIFHVIKEKKQAIDGVIVTDNIKNTDARHLYKTVRTRVNKINAKFFSISSDTTKTQEIYEYVDKVLHTPLLPHEFISTINECFEHEEIESGNKILIVEDDKVQQFILNKIIEKQDYQVHKVSTGEEAIEYCNNNYVDLIFMDCIMPGMGGIEATKIIRKNEEKEGDVRKTIIGATALKSAKEHSLCIEAGMDYVISKPYKTEEIVKVINKHLAIKKIS